MLKVFTTTSDRSKCSQLERSLKHFNYDYHIVEHEWKGFLDKIHQAYKYLKGLEGYSHFLYTDAWDTFALGKIDKVPDGLTFSAERACYPHPEKEVLYPKHDSPWHFVNGGGWCGEIKAFIEMYECCPPIDELNDQVYLTDRFLAGWAKLDYNCEIFQTIAFCPESDFRRGKLFVDIEGFELWNTVTKTRPCFWHGNGHTPMQHIYDLL
jgi:hypothetical protein